MERKIRTLAAICVVTFMALAIPTVSAQKQLRQQQRETMRKIDRQVRNAKNAARAADRQSKAAIRNLQESSERIKKQTDEMNARVTMMAPSGEIMAARNVMNNPDSVTYEQVIDHIVSVNNNGKAFLYNDITLGLIAVAAEKYLNFDVDIDTAAMTKLSVIDQFCLQSKIQKMFTIRVYDGEAELKDILPGERGERVIFDTSLVLQEALLAWARGDNPKASKNFAQVRDIEKSHPSLNSEFHDRPEVLDGIIASLETTD